MAIELRQLRYFAAVAEAGKVSLAAERLYLTQPALSQALHQLERELGVELLRRHSRGVELTAAGSEFLVEAYACVSAADRAIASAARHARGHNEQLVVGVFLECFQFLVEPLERFSRVRPDVRIEVHELDFVNQLSALDEGRVDIALLCEPPPDAPTFAVSDEPLLVGLARRHPLAARTVLAVDDVADEVFPRVPPGVPTYWSDRLLLKAERGGTPPRLTERIYSRPPEVVPDIATGKMVSPGPAHVAERFARGPIVAIPLADVPPVVVGFTWRRASAAVRAFIQTLRVIADLPVSAPPG